MLNTHWLIFDRVFKDAILFEQNGNIGNLAHMSPSLVSTRHAGKTYFHMLGGGLKPMIFVSVIIVTQSHLVDSKISGNGKAFKVIEGHFLSGEHEQLVGATNMVICEQEFKAQIHMDNLSFTTAFATSDSSE